MRTTPIIRADGVSRRYGATLALDDVTFTVETPAIIGLLGRNGAGKTTLMAALSGQDRPTDGRLLLDGEDPFESTLVQNRISFLRDNQRYPDDYRLRNVLRIAPWFHHDWDDDLAGRLIEAFRLPLKTKVRAFSRGQLSALGIVVGLASRAPITFLDEPHLGLDATARQYFYDTLVTDWAAHPRTVIVSTHLIDEMSALFGRVLVLDAGKLILDRDADALAGYAHTVSGIGGIVDTFVADSRILRRRSVGALTTVTVEGPIDRDAAAEARLRGVDISPATLQQVVNALGDHPAEPSADGARQPASIRKDSA